MNRVNKLEELHAAVPLDPALAGMISIHLMQEREHQTAVWEAPFPMTARTQQDMADNHHRVVQEEAARIVRRLIVLNP